MTDVNDRLMRLEKWVICLLIANSFLFFKIGLDNLEVVMGGI